MGEVLIIGVAGGSGSGKTTFATALAERLEGNAAVVSHDSYYRARTGMSFKERSKINFDHPDAYETDLFVRDLKALRQGTPVQIPIYDFAIHDRLSRTVEFHPSPVIIVEGMLVLHETELRELMDAKVFVDVDDDLRILRRALRDVKERGRSLDSVAEQYLCTVKPMHEQYVEPSKQYADIVVPSDGSIATAADMLASWARERIS